MSIYQSLQARHLVDNITSPTLKDKLSAGGLTFYVGFDPTADSYHIGQLAIFNLMRFLKRAGHRPIALVGGATGMIGDPGGKSKERVLLTNEQIGQHIQGQKKQLDKFLRTDDKQGVTILNNGEWLGRWGYLEFLRDVGKHFSVNQMMMRDSVKSRLSREGEGISYTEFSYMLLQSYDYYHLCTEHDCTLQVGGSDQWGNIVSGVDLTRRLAQKEVFGLTMPLLIKADGSKFGKSEQGTVWLDENKTSPYAFYQFFVRTEDADVEKMLCMLTDIPLEEIAELVSTLQDRAHLRLPQIRLAESVTRWVHGEAQLSRVQRASQVMYGESMSDLDDDIISQIFADVPTHQVRQDQLQVGWGLLDALVESGACQSKSQARQLVSSGGVYVNNQQEKDITLKLTLNHLASSSFIVLRTGKRNYRLISVG